MHLPTTNNFLGRFFFSVFSHVDKVSDISCANEDRAALTCTPYHDSSKRNVEQEPQRIQKAYRQRRHCSRRGRRIIENGNVRVNGKVAQLVTKLLEDAILSMTILARKSALLPSS